MGADDERYGRSGEEEAEQVRGLRSASNGYATKFLRDYSEAIWTEDCTIIMSVGEAVIRR